MKMRTFRPIRKSGSKRSGQFGSMLLEVLIAIVVLAIGMGGLIPLLVSSMYTNTNSSTDTTATMLAEHILEQIAAQPTSATTANLSITDCAGTSWNVATQGATLNNGSGTNGGNGANLTSSGYVDWTQDYGNVASNYAAKYVACGSGGAQRTYEVRWDVITMSTYTRMIVISARPVGETSGLHYVVPVNLRTIGGA